MADKEVEYRDIPGHPGYRAGDDGSIWSCWRAKGLGRGRGTMAVMSHTAWRRLKSPPDDIGRPVVQLGRKTRRYVARLILEAFIGPCPPGMECCHYPDRDPGNCRLDNLRWGTSADNTDDQRRHGTLIGGERHGMAKLTDAEVDEIRALEGKMTQAKIGAMFGIKQPHVSEILAGKKRTESSHSGKGL